ncbi:Golgi apyrase, partial [Tetrabaena socialis]
GSSGTRVRVFRYRPARWPSYVALALPEPSHSIEPGLSTYATQPQQAADSLGPLLQFAAQHVPAQHWAVTPVRLLATAGLRLLSDAQQEALLEACRGTLAASAFLFEPAWVEVIGGHMEGLYGWAAINYITGALQEAAGHAHFSRKDVLDPSLLFTGLLEMGGASMQVTFLPTAAERLSDKHGSELHLPGVPNRLYAHSYLGLGMDAAQARAAELVLRRRPRTGNVADPCLPIGEDGRYGNASFAQCLAAIHEVLPELNCSAPLAPSPPAQATATAASNPTSHGAESSSGSGGGLHGRSVLAPGGGAEGCMLQGSHMPALTGRFMAVENFAWTARALGLPASATLRELREGGGRYCARHWSSLHAEFSGHIPDQFLVRYCFGAAYILALLHSGLGMGLDDARLTWTNSITDPHSGAEVGLNWVLGAAVVEAMNGGAGAARGRGGAAGATGSARFWTRDDEGDEGEGGRA